MTRHNLIPKQIVNAKGVQTTVYVRSDQVGNLSHSPLRPIGLPASSSGNSIQQDGPARLRATPKEYDTRPKGISHRVTKYSDPALVTQDLPVFAGKKAEQTVMGWVKTFHDPGRRGGPRTQTEHLMSEGRAALERAQYQNLHNTKDDHQDEVALWSAYVENMTRRLGQGDADITLFDARRGLSARLRGADIRGVAHYEAPGVVRINDKVYDLAQYHWSTERAHWGMSGISEAI